MKKRRGCCVQRSSMTERVQELQRCIAEKYQYEVEHLGSHAVAMALEDGGRFEGVVDEFEITRGSEWRGCFGWLASGQEESLGNDCPYGCFAVPKFAPITDAA